MDWSNVKSTTVPNLKTLSSLGAGSLAKVSNFIKIEIFRDFWQIISLFFEGLEQALPDSYRDIIGNFSVTISFCFSCWLNAEDTQKWIGIIIFILMSLVALAGSMFFYCQSNDPDEQNQGLDVTTWAGQGRKYKKRLKWLLMILTTLYLPIFRDIILSLSCDIKYFPNDGECESGVYYFLVFLSVVMIVVYIIPLPIILYRIVQKNKPIPSLFDAEGNRRIGGYTDADYRADLDKDECPYKIIYDGYERNWAYYKVMVLVIKIILVLPVVLFVNTNKVGDRDEHTADKGLLAVQSVWTILVLLAYGGLSTYSQPFIKDSDDQIDLIARLTAFIISVLGFISSQMPGDSADFAFGLILNLVTFIGGIIIIFYVLSGFKKVQQIIQKLQQRVTFTLTRDTMKPMIFSTQLSIERERKFRIWHEFWDTLFRQDKNFRIPEDESATKKKQNVEEEEEKKEDEEDKYEPKILGFQYGGSPPYLIGFEGTVGERHQENKEIIEHESFESYIEFLKIKVNNQDPQNIELLNCMKYIIENLNGVDVFWDGNCVNINEKCKDEVEDAKETENESATKFGKMYIIPFPFCAVFLSDDNDKSTNLFSISPVIAGKVFDVNKGKDNIRLLMQRNIDPEIQRRKGVRLRLRALEGTMCHWPIQKWKSKKISRTVKGSDGNSKTETKTVQVLFSFNDGVFNIGKHKVKAKWQDIDITRGFVSSLHYADGTGHHHDAAWGKDYNWQNEQIDVYGEDFGLNDQFQETEIFMRFLGANYKHDIHEPKRGEIIENFRRYSEFYKQQFLEKENVLSYAFWYYVYNNDSVDKDELKEILKFEGNDKLKGMIDDIEYVESINMVYDKLKFFNTNKKHSFWFIFWHDLWMNNMLMPPFIKNEDYLSPFKHTSICYKFIENKDELIKELEDKGLHGRQSGIRKGWINQTIVDLLYAKMEDLENANVQQNEQQEIQINPRKSKTMPLQENNDNDDIDTNIVEEYSRACKIIANICGQE